MQRDIPAVESLALMQFHVNPVALFAAAVE